jgi:hypothetical protein
MDSTSWGNISFQGPQWVFDIFLTRVDSLGNFYWGLEVPHTPNISGDFETAKSNFLAADEFGNAYVFGNLRGTIDWGNGVISSSGLISHGQAVIVSFDYNGTPRWTLSGGCSTNNNASSLSYSASGSLYFSLSARDTTTFETLSTNLGNGFASIFGKLSSNSSTGITVPDGKGNLLFYPNPVKDNLQFNVSNSEPLDLFIFDGTGKLILQKSFPGERVHQIDVSTLGSGVYLMRLIAGSKVLTGKIMKP